MVLDALLSKGLLPEPIIRKGIQSLLSKRLEDERKTDQSPTSLDERLNGQIAIKTKDANEQHYELPTSFFQATLGDYLKYSCCYFDNDNQTLSQAEQRMLDLYIERAEIQDGQNILDLGCGWGSFSLYAAGKFSKSSFTAVSNSKIQRAYIEDQIAKRGLTNLSIQTTDINQLKLDKKFDRIVSVEMFEHTRNFEQLFKKLSNWLNDDGHLFVHIFTHNNLTYFFDYNDSSDWMTKYFFAGGVMPSANLFYQYNDDLKVTDYWKVSGMHYSKTAEKWLENIKENKDQVMAILKGHYGDDAAKWFNYWKVFFMSCSELWKYRNGEEWYVSHYKLKKANT